MVAESRCIMVFKKEMCVEEFQQKLFLSFIALGRFNFGAWLLLPLCSTPAFWTWTPSKEQSQSRQTCHHHRLWCASHRCYPHQTCHSPPHMFNPPPPPSWHKFKCATPPPHPEEHYDLCGQCQRPDPTPGFGPAKCKRGRPNPYASADPCLMNNLASHIKDSQENNRVQKTFNGVCTFPFHLRTAGVQQNMDFGFWKFAGGETFPHFNPPPPWMLAPITELKCCPSLTVVTPWMLLPPLWFVTPTLHECYSPPPSFGGWRRRQRSTLAFSGHISCCIVALKWAWLSWCHCLQIPFSCTWHKSELYSSLGEWCSSSPAQAWIQHSLCTGARLLQLVGFRVVMVFSEMTRTFLRAKRPDMSGVLFAWCECSGSWIGLFKHFVVTPHSAPPCSEQRLIDSERLTLF